MDFRVFEVFGQNQLKITFLYYFWMSGGIYPARSNQYDQFSSWIFSKSSDKRLKTAAYLCQAAVTKLKPIPPPLSQRL